MNTTVTKITKKSAVAKPSSTAARGSASAARPGRKPATPADAEVGCRKAGKVPGAGTQAERQGDRETGGKEPSHRPCQGAKTGSQNGQ